MSDKSAVQITVRFRQPLWATGVLEITIPGLESYTHVIAVDGGFKSASLSFNAHSYEIDEWLESGLGRQVEIFGPGGQIIWQGVVNEISAVIGTLNVVRGPMMNIANRVSVVYTPYIDITVDPPTTGTATETVIVEDSESQEKYGIQEAVVNGGTLVDDTTYCGVGCTPDNEAEAVRDAYLQENKYPETKESINIESTSVPKITINCVGWVEFLNKYVYNNDEALSVQIPTKLRNILAADPNNIFSTNYDYIEDSAALLWLVNSYEDQNKMAWAIIQEELALGDANDNRTIFGIYEDRLAHFSAIPSEIEYIHRITNSKPSIEMLNGTYVDPWDVRPGKWTLLADFMVGRPFPSVMRADPRNLFIESVSYTMPFGLTLQGGKIEKVKQLMAKFGTGA